MATTQNSMAKLLKIYDFLHSELINQRQHLSSLLVFIFLFFFLYSKLILVPNPTLEGVFFLINLYSTCSNS